MERNAIRSIRVRARNTRWNLGIPSLIPEWRRLFSKEHLRADTIAAAVLACVAVPLSLAIALASSVPPAVGLTTAIIAGIVCALFGGTPLAVSGPAAAMAVLVGSVVEQYGMGGLLAAGIVCGALQLITGVSGLGRIIRYVPVTVVHGFTAGVGAIILIGQLPRALGLPPPDEAHVFDVITHLGEFISHTRLPALLIALSSLAIVLVLPRFAPKIPALLVAVLIPSAVAYAFALDIQTIGAIPRTLPLPSFTAIDWHQLGPIFSSGLIIYAIASLETLLSSSSVDKLSGSKPHDPDQELIGQGLGNLVVPLFGGIPVTGVIVRSSVNVFAGGKTRRAAILHSVFLLLIVAIAAPAIAQVPIAALAGVLISVAFRMLNPRQLWELWKISRSEAGVFLLTFSVMVFVNLLVGVQAGFVAALLVTVIRVTDTKIRVFISDRQKGPSRIDISGPLTFVSVRKLDVLRAELRRLENKQRIIIDITTVPTIDISGADHLLDILADLRTKGVDYAIISPSPLLADRLMASDLQGLLRGRVASSESQATSILGAHASEVSLTKMVIGVQRYQDEIRPRYESLFEELAQGQTPHTMLITCADSRINPNLITNTAPGELFILRNLGNIIAPPAHAKSPDIGAALEFGINVLHVGNIIVCGHSRCGAMQAMHTDLPESCEHLAQWKESSLDLVPSTKQPAALDDYSKKNVVKQLQHIQNYSCVHDAMATKGLMVHGWFYDIEQAQVLRWEPSQEKFVYLVASGLASSASVPSQLSGGGM